MARAARTIERGLDVAARAFGAQALSEAELLTALLGPTSGANQVSKVVTALLDTAPLAELAWASPEQLQTVPGIGPARAVAIAAAFELGRRAGWTPPRRGDRVTAHRAYELMRHLAFAPQEEFWVKLLDSFARLIKSVRIAQGGYADLPLSPRDVFRKAIRANAPLCMFVHGHPSGSVTPSQTDLEFTQYLRAAADIVGVRPRDHIIVAASGYYSFVENGTWRL